MSAATALFLAVACALALSVIGLYLFARVIALGVRDGLKKPAKPAQPNAAKPPLRGTTLRPTDSLALKRYKRG